MSKSDKVEVFSCKTYSTKQGKMVAACDVELLGRSFKEGKKRLKINEEFYKGNEVTYGKVKEEVEAAQIANLVGNALISKLVEEGYLAESEVKRVNGVPHSQIFVI